MELYNIYCDFWEGMKEISVGVCLNDYTWLEIWKIKWIVQKDQVKKKFEKKNGLEQKQKEKKKEIEVQFELCCVKLVELMIFEKKNYTPLVFRNYFVPYISFLHIKPLTL